jgi:nicotinate-nucleotide adenylyltransferase
MQPIGIFGGSFDPVHSGHLALARVAKRQFGLKRVYFVPAKHPPHKMGRALAPAKDRINMLNLCGVKNISRFELNRPGTTYTWRTLKYFRARFPNAQLYFILGGDSLSELSQWKRPDLIIKLCTIAAGARTGTKFYLPKVFAGSVVKLRGTIPRVSSTEIRRRIANAQPVTKFVKRTVAQYIAKRRLYENND